MPRVKFLNLTHIFFVLLLSILVINCVENAGNRNKNLGNTNRDIDLPQLASDIEPNDSFGTASSIQLGNSWNGRCYDNTEGDHWDYYKITIDTADTLKIIYSATDGLMINVYNSTPATIGIYGGTSGTISISVSSGLHYIYVEGGSTLDIDYSMEVTSNLYEQEQNNNNDKKDEDEGDGTGDDEGNLWEELFGGEDSEGIFGDAEGTEVATTIGIAGIVGAAGVVSIVVVNSVIIPKRRAAKTASRQVTKAKNLHITKNFAAGITALAGIMNLLTAEQINELTRRIRKILKKLAKKYEDEKKKLAGKLVRSHININNDKIEKALKRTQKVQKIAKKKSHELILKEADDLISKINELEER